MVNIILAITTHWYILAMLCEAGLRKTEGTIGKVTKEKAHLLQHKSFRKKGTYKIYQNTLREICIISVMPSLPDAFYNLNVFEI